jgi:hypothetical protein
MQGIPQAFGALIGEMQSITPVQKERNTDSRIDNIIFFDKLDFINITSVGSALFNNCGTIVPSIVAVSYIAGTNELK